MLDNDNITSTSVSVAVEKIPADKKSSSQMLLYSILLCAATAYKEQTNMYYL